MIYYLSLGSNLGDRNYYLMLAKSYLKKLGKIAQSSGIYETKPFQMESGRLFLNQVIKFETELKPRQLLQKIKEIEKEVGRTEEQGHNCDRVIDIDILLAEGIVLAEDALKIPHPRLTEREFVLEPLAEIAPQAEYPLNRKKICELLAQLKKSDHSES